MEGAELSQASEARFEYDGFISYSHAADDLLAPRLQSGLQRFAKPWWRRRALRIFRDESSLSANPHLWSSITEALDRSGWFVLLLSPDAAGSEWVNQEIEYWKGHKDPARMLPVLTKGTFEWSEGDVTGTAVPEQLEGAFSEEPRWVDLRFARDETDLDLKNPRFADAVADIASAIQGVPKDELASEEVKQHRRTVRTAWGAAALVSLLAITAIILAIESGSNAERAEAEAARANEEAARAEANAAAEAEARTEAEANARLARARELGAAAVEALGSDPRLARILALEAIVAGESQDAPSTVVNALWQSLLTDKLAKEVATGLPGHTPVVLSDDATLLVVTSDEGRAAVGFTVPGGDEQWRVNRPDSSAVSLPAVSPTGSLVALGVWGPEGGSGPPTRLEVLDANDGSVLATVDYPACAAVEPWSWSPDGTRLAINNGIEPCPREEVEGGIWVEVLDTTTWQSVAVIESQDPWFAEPHFDDAGNLYILGAETPATVHFAEDYSSTETFVDAIGTGDVAPDGSLIAVFTGATGEPLQLISTSTGEVVDSLHPMQGQPVDTLGMTFSATSRQLVVATHSNETYVWETQSGRLVHTIPSGPSDSASISPDGRWVYTSHDNGVVRFWDLGPRRANTTAAGDLGSYRWVNANSFAIGESLGAFQAIDLAGDCATFCSQIRFFDPTTGELLEFVADEYAAVFALPDGRFAVQDFDFSVYLVDPERQQNELLVDCDRDEQGNCLGSLGTFGEVVRGVLVSADTDEVGLRRARTPPEEVLQVVDLSTGEVVEETPSQNPILAFSSEWVLTTSSEGEFIVLERGSGDELQSGSLSVSWWEPAPSGRRAGIFTFDGDLALLEFDNWDITEFDIDVGQVRGMGFGPEERRIALGDEAGIHIFDFERGLVTQTIPIPGVSDIYWLDDEMIVIGTNDGLWATVSLSVDDLIEAARNPLVQRQFTEQECLTYRIDPCPAIDEIQSR